jgi:hypothetical protein
VSANSKAVHRWRQSVRQAIVASLGGECCICGYNRCIRSLAAHHVDPEAKDFNISQAKCIAWEKTVIELRKCVLLCHNCHGEVHEGIVIVPRDARRFDEKFAVKPPTPSTQRERSIVTNATHGTLTAYYNLGCRCDTCRENASCYARERYRLRKATKQATL